MHGSHAKAGRLKRLAWAGLAVAALASTALAQDYTVTSQSSQWVTPPTSGTSDALTNMANKDDGTYTITNLPFDIPYFGVPVDKVTVCTNGYCFMNAVGYYTYGYSPISIPQSNGSQYDGIVKVAMTDGDGQGSNAKLLYWSDGTAPNRRFIVTWLNWQHYYITGSANFQVQFYETGRIQIAYTGTWTWSYTTGVGIDAIGTDIRFAAPNNSGSYTFSGTPSNDWRFEPDLTAITGTANIRNVVSDGSGFGNSQASAIPALGLKVELRSGTTANASGFLDSTGEFDMKGAALNSANTGKVALVSESLGCSVSPSTTEIPAAAYSVDIEDDVSYGEDTDVGTFLLDDQNDSDGSKRAPMQIASHLETIRTIVQDITGENIPHLEVFFDDNSGSPSRYTPAGTETPAWIRISGAAASNPDSFDSAILSRLYMRHVIASITGESPNSFNQSLDVTTDAQNAFADGLGLYVNALITGDSMAYDGTSSSATIAFDLEDPSLSRAEGPTVGGWAAAALYDLLDPANEDHDLIDGTSGTNADRVFTVLGDLDAAPTPDSFLDAWAARGYDGSGLASIFIHHGLLPDDTSEPNDLRETAQSLGIAGVRATGLTLNRFNEDWFGFTVENDADAFFVEMVFDRFNTAAEVELEVFNATGARIATGSPDGDNGPIRATIANLAAGDYTVRLAHISGGTITPYELQAYAQMSLALSSAPAWTVGKRIQEPLALFGGIPPYTIQAKDGNGDIFTAIQFIASQGATPFDMVWTPREVGSVAIQIIASDAGEPTHTRTLNLNFTVNAELAFSAPELTGVALDKVADVNLGRVGGTDPITLSDEVGDLPGGLTIEQDYHIRGTASEPGGGAFGFKATDVAGSEATVDSFLVVCVPIETKKQPVPLAGGQAAAGFYFDALQGSSASFKLKTAKKRAKRELNFLVIGPDGNVVQGGVAKIKAGSVKIKNLIAPSTGRYFMAFESDDGGPETELQGTLKLKLPKKSTGGFEQMALEDELYKIEFGALKGATFNLKGKTTEGMEIQVLFVIRPNGEVLAFDATTVTNNKGKVVISTTALPEDGTYQLYVRPQKADLADFSYKLKVKNPKGGEFNLDD